LRREPALWRRKNPEVKLLFTEGTFSLGSHFGKFLIFQNICFTLIVDFVLISILQNTGFHEKFCFTLLMLIFIGDFQSMA
jgi:hypothetical protein